MFNAWHISVYYFGKLVRSGFTYFFFAVIALIYFARLFNDQQQVEKPYYDPNEALVSYARDLIGIPYQAGGINSAGFDCSGFTRHVYDNFKISLPRAANSQFNSGSIIQLSDAEKGDLVFFNEAGDPHRKATHVGIISRITGSTVEFLHASTAYGITTDSLTSPYFSSRFIGIRRWLHLRETW